MAPLTGSGCHVASGAAQPVEYDLHQFEDDGVTSLEIIWPDGTRKVLRDLNADQILTVRQPEAAPASP